MQKNPLSSLGAVHIYLQRGRNFLEERDKNAHMHMPTIHSGGGGGGGGGGVISTFCVIGNLT